ncbi:tetratricopeptide repeat protein [Clostridium cellulovorans]|uniref:NB-ARC domain protein n=1 Tax=Clostridium cellulovorans (strain ATCC 35296 / DSM 3052 / OCM 3 / 743B) TaxID=573061 RepID=D9SP55_CLOC7|nr:tetratricopeptide repeat protein [Clostridium cellulovorans]ADL52020.1 NB-ARC domain protein [Clostridium cellulovorans 743B]
MKNHSPIKSSLPANCIELIGRAVELEEMYKQLKTRNSVLLVSGIGGVGKTELCRTFFIEHMDAYDNAIWIDYKDSIKESFANQCELDSFNENDTLEQRYKKVINFIKEKNSGSKLIVIDNIENERDEGILEITRYISNRVKILATSRLTIDGYSSYYLDFLSEEKCKKLFYYYYKRQEDESNLEKIINLAARHTLIIELLAKTAQNAKINIRKLYEILLEKGFNLNEVIKEKVSMIKDGNMVSEQLFNQVLKVFDLSKVSEEEQYILMNLSILPQVDLQELVEWLDLETNEDINSLEKKGWISINSVNRKDIKGENDTTDIISVHPLIQETIRYKLKPDTYKCINLIEAVNEALHTEPKDNPLDKKGYTIFGESIYKYLNEEKEELAYLLDNLSLIYEDLGELQKSLEYQMKAVTIRENLLVENHPDLAMSYNNLSLIYKDLGELEKGLKYQKKAVAIREKILDENHPDLGRSYNNLALVYQALGQLEKSLEYQIKAVSIIEKALGEMHPDLATTQNTLSMIYRELGELEKSLEYQIKAVTIREEVLEERHPDLVRSYNNLSMIYKDLGLLGKSLEYEQKVVSVGKIVYGENHPELAISYNNLSLIYQELGQLEESLKYQMQSVEIKEKIFEVSHPSLAKSYNNLSMIYKDLGELHKSLGYQEKAIDIREKVLGEKHPDLATSYDNLSMIYKELEDLEKSLRYQMQAIGIKENALGENHPSLATSYNNLSLIYKALGELEKSLEYQLEAVDIGEKALPSNHPNLAILYDNLANIYEELGQVDKSHNFKLKADKIRKRNNHK